MLKIIDDDAAEHIESCDANYWIINKFLHTAVITLKEQHLGEFCTARVYEITKRKLSKWKTKILSKHQRYASPYYKVTQGTMRSHLNQLDLIKTK